MWANNTNTTDAILAQAKVHDSFYLYNQASIAQAAQDLQEAFAEFSFLYSLKNNPCKQIADTLFSAGFGTDAASLGEVMQSVAAGLPKEKIQYSAPGKTDRDIAAALPHATLIADSLGEIMRIQAIAAAQNIVVEIGVRIHPAFAFDAQGYAPSKFGIEESQAFAAISGWKKLQNLRITGLHIHCRSQSLSENDLQQYHKNVFDCALRFQSALGYSLDFLNMGAGLGIPYAPDDAPLRLAAIASSTRSAYHAYRSTHPHTRVYIETGRYCVGNHGIYVSKVIDKKTCGDKTFVVLANTLNGFIRPCIANVLEANSATPAVAEPLYTSKQAFSIYTLASYPDFGCCPQIESVTLVGNLCTAADTLARDIPLPALYPGDLVITTNAGSYAAVLSPMQFSQQTPPAQLLLCADGSVIACDQ